MLGQIEEWFYHDLAGIRSDGNGFKEISIAPQPCGDIHWARASFDSIRGRIVSDWRIEGDKFFLAVTIPPNTTAKIYMPAKSAANVEVDGEPVALSDAVRVSRVEDGRVVCKVGSGNYEFMSVAP